MTRPENVETSKRRNASRQQAVRFVVLRHTDRQGVHFDLMIDQGNGLATWKCPQPPESAGPGGRACTRIADHRRRYLDYEGPIAGDRGTVQRHDQGVCVVHSSRTDVWEVAFTGDRLAGRYILKRQNVKTSKRQDAETERLAATPKGCASQPWSLRPLAQ